MLAQVRGLIPGLVSGHKPAPRWVARRRAARRLLLAAVVLVAGLGLTGCLALQGLLGGGSGDGARETGKVRVQVALGAVQEQAGSIAGGEVVMTQGGLVVRQGLEFSEEAASAVVSGLWVGEWQLAVTLWDSAQQPLFGASAVVEVRPDQETAVSLVLRPVPGTLDLRVILDGIPFDGDLSALKGRIYFLPSGKYESFAYDRPDGGMGGSFAVTPGSYDGQIRIYDGSYSRSPIYESYWFPLDIHAGRTTTVVWKPQTGSVPIVGVVDDAPGAPAGLTAALEGDRARLSWQPVPDPEADLAGYRIYRRVRLGDPYEAVGETAATEYLHTLDPLLLEEGATVWFTVTAFDLGGQESLRSAEAAVTVPAARASSEAAGGAASGTGP